jgi:hypothetical protein
MPHAERRGDSLLPWQLGSLASWSNSSKQLHSQLLLLTENNGVSVWEDSSAPVVKGKDVRGAQRSR